MMWYVVYIHIHYHRVQKIRNLSITGYRAIVVRYQRTTDVCGTAGTPVLRFLKLHVHMTCTCQCMYVCHVLRTLQFAKSTPPRFYMYKFIPTPIHLTFI